MSRESSQRALAGQRGLGRSRDRSCGSEIGSSLFSNQIPFRRVFPRICSERQELLETQSGRRVRSQHEAHDRRPTKKRMRRDQGREFEKRRADLPDV